MRYTAIGLAALLLAGCGGDDDGAPQGPDPTGFVLAIEGTVRAETVLSPIVGARVAIKMPEGRRRDTTTDTDGNFAVRARLPHSACEWVCRDHPRCSFIVACTVDVAAVGYRPKSIQREFRCHAPQRLDIALKPV